MTELAPTELLLPWQCLRCKTFQESDAAAVMEGAVRGLPCRECGTRHNPGDIGTLSFVRRSEWEAWDDSDPEQRPPDIYHIGAVTYLVAETKESA